MQLQDIFEAATDDVRRSDMANEYIHAVYSYLYRTTKTLDQLSRVVYGAEDRIAVFPNEFECPGIFKTVILSFRHSDYPGVSGSAAVLAQPQGNLKYFVTMDADTTSMETLRHSVHSQTGRQVLLHELQHILDYTRFKDKSGISKRPVVVSKKQSSDGMSPEETEALQAKKMSVYHNDTLELNAFFHNLAEPLLDRLRWLKRDSPAIEFYDPLTRDFREYFNTTVVKQKYNVVAQHWKNISETNKRKVIARLHRLFDLYHAQVDEYEARKAKYPDDQEVQA